VITIQRWGGRLRGNDQVTEVKVEVKKVKTEVEKIAGLANQNFSHFFHRFN
jgi:hypothetical protein